VKTVLTVRRVRRNAAQRRSAYTLVELLASTAATGILLAGMASAIFVAARAADPDTMPSNTIRGSSIVEDIAAELRSAVSFDTLMSTSVEFAVADRDNDASPETIAYDWSGTPGDPLERTYNGGDAVEIVENVHEFQLGYCLGTITAEEGSSAIVQHYIRHITITLQIVDSSAAQINSIVQILNTPEISAQ